MSEDRLVRMKDVKDAIRELFQFAPSHDEAVVVQRWIGETFFKVDDVFLALDGVPDAERVRPTAELSKCADPENVLMHRDICTYLNELYARKNHDYGDSFHKTWLEEGAAAARLRIGDKFNRYKELSRGSDRLVGDETIEDTLIDMANYSIMALMEHRREAEEK
jgi:hypothetical protein